VTRPWQRAVTWLPAPLRRRIYVDQLRFAPSELEGLVFKLAETRNERDQAFSVVHDAYARRGIIAPHPSGWFATPFSFLPTTATVVAKAGDRVIGTVSLVEDSPCGLPLEAAYPGTVDTYRRRSRRVAEVSSLAVTPGLRGRGVPFMLYYLMFRWAYPAGSTAPGDRPVRGSTSSPSSRAVTSTSRSASPTCWAPKWPRYHGGTSQTWSTSSDTAHSTGNSWLRRFGPTCRPVILESGPRPPSSRRKNVTLAKAGARIQGRA